MNRLIDVIIVTGLILGVGSTAFGMLLLSYEAGLRGW